MPTLHFLTIGESPRPDTTPELLRWLAGAEAGFRIREAGALDGLSREAIRAAAPRTDARPDARTDAGPEGEGASARGNGNMPLVSRLRDGTEVLLRERFVERRILALARAIPPTDVGAILCTGHFLDAPPHVVRAGGAFDAALAEDAVSGETVGILIPDGRQAEDAMARLPFGTRGLTAVASPYRESAAVAAAARRDLAGCDRIAMNCLGYTGAQAKAVAEAAGKPVLLARRALAEAVRRRLLAVRPHS